MVARPDRNTRTPGPGRLLTVWDMSGGPLRRPRFVHTAGDPACPACPPLSVADPPQREERHGIRPCCRPCPIVSQAGATGSSPVAPINGIPQITSRTQRAPAGASSVSKCGKRVAGQHESQDNLLRCTRVRHLSRWEDVREASGQEDAPALARLANCPLERDSRLPAARRGYLPPAEYEQLHGLDERSRLVAAGTQ
jgi:hypothetical protein